MNEKVDDEDDEDDKDDDGGGVKSKRQWTTAERAVVSESSQVNDVRKSIISLKAN